MDGPVSPSALSQSSFSLIDSVSSLHSRSSGPFSPGVYLESFGPESELGVEAFSPRSYQVGALSPRTDFDDEEGDYVLISPGSSLLLRPRSASAATDASDIVVPTTGNLSSPAEEDEPTSQQNLKKEGVQSEHVQSELARLSIDQDFALDADKVENTKQSTEKELTPDELTSDEVQRILQAVQAETSALLRAETPKPTVGLFKTEVVENQASGPLTKTNEVGTTGRIDEERTSLQPNSPEKKAGSSPAVGTASDAPTPAVAKGKSEAKRRQRRKKKLLKAAAAKAASTAKEKPKEKPKTAAQPSFPDSYESDDEDLQSEYTSVNGDVTAEIYKEAVEHVTLYLNNPPPKPPKEARLRFFQSLIIELGLLSVGDNLELPSSCRAAKKLLKSRIFINVGEYVKERNKSITVTTQDSVVKAATEVSPSLETLRSLLHPSRSALAKSLKKNRKIVPLKWIKSRNLDVFLVHLFR